MKLGSTKKFPLTILGYVCIASVLAACAVQPVPMITPEPTFDKFGGGTCEDGYVYIPGTVPEFAECIPEDDCDLITLADGSVVWDCTPPPIRERDPDPDRDRDPGRDDSSTTGRDPTGAPGTPAG